MVQKPLNQPEVEALLRRSETARRRIAYDVGVLKHRVDVPARLKESLQLHPSGWLGGSLFTGIATSLLLRRRKSKPVPIEKKARRVGLAGLALTAGSALAKPLLTSLLRNYVQRAIVSRFEGIPPRK